MSLLVRALAAVSGVAANAPTLGGKLPSFVVIRFFDVASVVSGNVTWEEILARSLGRSRLRFLLPVCGIWVDFVTATVHV